MHGGCRNWFRIGGFEITCIARYEPDVSWALANSGIVRPRTPLLGSRIAACPGGEIGRRKGLNEIEPRMGNSAVEWGQIQGNLSASGGGNPELSPFSERVSVET